MIKILKNWDDIGEAIKFLRRKNLPLHESPEKNWDMYNLYLVTKGLNRNSRILDLGSGNLFGIKLMLAQGFSNIEGIDLIITPKNRLTQLKYFLKKKLFRLTKGDFLQTAYIKNTFDILFSISVIEHGVDLNLFFKEAKRITKRNGILFLTTDFWPTEIKLHHTNKPFNQNWKLSSKKDIEDLITIAKENNFRLLANKTIPQTKEKCVIWNGYEYTFIALAFKKNT